MLHCLAIEHLQFGQNLVIDIFTKIFFVCNSLWDFIDKEERILFNSIHPFFLTFNQITKGDNHVFHNILISGHEQSIENISQFCNSVYITIWLLLSGKHRSLISRLIIPLLFSGDFLASFVISIYSLKCFVLTRVW